MYLLYCHIFLNHISRKKRHQWWTLSLLIYNVGTFHCLENFETFLMDNFDICYRPCLVGKDLECMADNIAFVCLADTSQLGSCHMILWCDFKKKVEKIRNNCIPW